MEDREGEGLLRLSLAVVSDCGGEKSRKRKRTMLNFNPLNSYEGKIFHLLQVREEMLKPDHKRKGVVEEDGKGLHLIHLLLITATAMDENNVSSALENLMELYRTVSLTGDSVQRVVAYFADGLAARLLTRKSPFYGMIMKEPTVAEEFKAYTCLYQVSPYYQFAHFTANQAILEAFEREYDVNNNGLHVIDFDLSYGFQWPSLIQSLSEKAAGGNRISLRLTGYGRTLEELQETETRLKKNETVAVNLCFHLNTLNNSSMISDSLKLVESLKPSIVILVEQEGSRTPRSFLSRFMESLHYYAAMFDSLDDCLPLESAERLSIEKNHLGKEIKNMLNCDKVEDPVCPRYEKNMETWRGRMESHGFVGMKLSSKCLIQAKLLLKIRNTHYCPLFGNGEGGWFRVFERDEGKAISLGWQDRCLLTASAWHCV
ncbi:hypothetical protein SLEP1_g40933 [Rubroshorea leprosula]|uniref:Uncharacterized protein n=1 Tax=Rubroshorea leprosula TaxID=152421 RepID=A0AAV5L513_9ROSI|nr:hypothetical protein SLEP1_g40933 [Rubroshorea leprosula]